MQRLRAVHLSTWFVIILERSVLNIMFVHVSTFVTYMWVCVAIITRQLLGWIKATTITLLSKRGITNQHLMSINLLGNRDIIIVLVKE